MYLLCSIFILLSWGSPINSESEEKRTTNKNTPVTSNPVPDTADRRPYQQEHPDWNEQTDWQKGWHDGWPVEYSWQQQWNRQPYGGYGQASTNQRNYDHLYSTTYQHKNNDNIGTYNKGHDYGHIRHSYSPYSNRLYHQNGYDNYDLYGLQRHDYSQHNRRDGYKHAVYRQPYNNYGYGKYWNRGR